MAQFKTTLTFPPELMDRIDAYCRSHYLTRSGFVQMASVNFLDAHDMASAMQELVKIVKDLSDKADNPDPEQLAQLDEIQKMFAIINSRFQ